MRPEWVKLIGLDAAPLSFGLILVEVKLKRVDPVESTVHLFDHLIEWHFLSDRKQPRILSLAGRTSKCSFLIPFVPSLFDTSSLSQCLLWVLLDK